jgi:flagellin-like hook-associated protein FlgL
MPYLLIVGLLLAAIAIVTLTWWQRQRVRRQRTLARLLDGADQLESLLDRSQDRLRSLRPLMQRVPADIAAGANASIDSNLPVLEAKRDLLQHRLWIREHAGSASQAELDEACAAMARVRSRLGGELSDLEMVRSDLKQATDAAAEAALREPPALRRPEP